MNILGISSFYHDSAAALIVDGEIMAAAQEERFSRIKNDAHFPSRAILFCLHRNNLSLKDVDHIVFYEKPFLKFERLMETYLNYAPSGFMSFKKAFPLWVKEKLFQKKLIIDYLKEIDPMFDGQSKILFNDHHMSHAASAYYPSPFNDSAVLTVDGVGEWATTTISDARDHEINPLKEIPFPHSLGLFYSAMTSFTGFRVNNGEYKMMGLAPFGEPKYSEIMKRELIKLYDDGSYSLNMDYFNYPAGLTMTRPEMMSLFNARPRKPGDPIDSVYMDIAASTQKVLEEALLNLVNSIPSQSDNLCLAGGVALNCVANSFLKKNSKFKNIWIQPAAGDAGGAIGAALSVWHQHQDKPRPPKKSRDGMKGCQLGPHYRQDYIENSLKNKGAVFTTHTQEEIISTTVEAIIAGQVVGWFQGPMEFGPRALGHRSILADPRRQDMQKTLNSKIKNRESFRPFAPAVLIEEIQNWFEGDVLESPYMLMTSKIKKEKQKPFRKQSGEITQIEESRSDVPSVTHMDYSARLQTVSEKHNPLFYKLISKFHEKTGVPMLINTSFNVRGEPIVCSPNDAFECFMNTEMDLLIVGSSILIKREQTQNQPQQTI